MKQQNKNTKNEMKELIKPQNKHVELLKLEVNR